MEVVTDKVGHWQAKLTAMPAATDGADLTVSGDGTLVLRDIVVGEVWLCSGQSNMHYPLELTTGAKAESATANLPWLRAVEINQTTSLHRENRFDGQWTVCTPATAGKFSAVAYYFARSLGEHLKIPIGLVHSSWGGTPIEAWMSERALLSSPDFDVVFKRWSTEIAEFPAKQRAYLAEQKNWREAKESAASAKEKFTLTEPTVPRGVDERRRPLVLFNAMIAPLAPYAMRGVLWYQGEDNTGRAKEYRALLEAMIRDWREEWANPTLPFVVVQLPGYNDPKVADGWAGVREAQRAASAALNDVTLVTTIDLGDVTTVHPKNKKEFGTRTALAVRGGVLREDVEYLGPIPMVARRENNAVRITFDHAEGLSLPASQPATFEVAGADGKFYAATATVDRHDLVVRTEVFAPTQLRYGWGGAPAPALVNSSGLPASPFVINVERQPAK